MNNGYNVRELYNSGVESTERAMSRGRGKGLTPGSSMNQRRNPGKAHPKLLDVAHTIQQPTRLLKPPPRSFYISVHVKVIHGNFTRSELECCGNLLDLRVALETKPTESVSKPGQRQHASEGASWRRGEQNDGTGRHTQNLSASVWGRLLMHPPEINSSSCPMPGEERHRS